MINDKRLSVKYYLLLVYLALLFTDCCFLLKGNYASRTYVKPFFAPALAIWFFRNTVFNIRSSSQTSTARLLIYFILFCTLISDFCGLSKDDFMWTAALFLYSVTYILYFFLFLSVQINTPEEKQFYIYVKKFTPTFLIIFCLAFIYIFKILKIPFEIGNIWFYTHAFIIALVSGTVANMWGIPKLRNIRILFALGVASLIATNLIYGIDEIIYHRKHHILDVSVAISNGLSQIFIILGVSKFIRLKKG